MAFFKNQISTRINKAVGFGVCIATTILSLIEFVFFYYFQNEPLIQALCEFSVLPVFLIGLLFLFTAYFLDKPAKILQVTTIIISGFFSATQAGSGDFSSFVIVAIGYLLAMEYGFLSKRIILKTSILGVIYIVFLIYGLSVFNKLTLIIALHTLVGAGMVFFLFFVLLRAQFDKEKMRRQDLEIKVEERTSELQRALSEKETLLREVHHRTKNNMQLISSLLNLEYSSVSDPKAIEAAQKSMRRIQALSTAHEYLHHSSNISNIYLHDYIGEFLSLIIGDMEVVNIAFKSYIDENIGANIEAAIPFGLIVNELISNSLKHAFNNMEEGLISLNVRADEKETVLTIEDNGQGIPEELDLKSADSIGMNIIFGLIDQLGGRYVVSRDNGTQWKIMLPMSDPELSVSIEKPVFYLLQK